LFSQFLDAIIAGDKEAQKWLAETKTVSFSSGRDLPMG
jgi:hypothetical protein